MNFLSLQASFYSRHFLFVCLTPASLFFTLLQPFNKGAKKRLGYPFIWIGITNIEDCFFLFNQRNFDKIWIFWKESQIGHEANSQIFFDEHKSYLGYNKKTSHRTCLFFFRRLLYPIFDRFSRPNQPLHLP